MLEKKDADEQDMIKEKLELMIGATLRKPAKPRRGQSEDASRAVFENVDGEVVNPFLVNSLTEEERTKDGFTMYNIGRTLDGDGSF